MLTYISGIPNDVTIHDGIITRITPSSPATQPTRWLLPGLVNMHTHSAMTLFRSSGSGLPLDRWLHEAIFPKEATLTDDDVLLGATLACQEMRSTGTAFFNDMYFRIVSTINAALVNRIGGIVSLSVTDRDFDQPDGELHSLLDNIHRYDHLLGDSLRVAIAPHSIYAVSGPHLQYLADFASEHRLPFHIHISETRVEREDCIRQHGVPPVVYLERLGVLDKVGDRFIGAHALWLDDTEIRLLADHKANVVHCPNSNLKLGSGYRFLYTELRDAGVNVTLGTDGCASSDNLDMIEAMKVMSLLQKGVRNDPAVLPSDEVLKVATTNGYRALGLPEVCIAEGQPANCFMVDLTRPVFHGVDDPALTPSERTKLFLDRLIYAAHGDVVVPCE